MQNRKNIIIAVIAVSVTAIILIFTLIGAGLPTCKGKDSNSPHKLQLKAAVQSQNGVEIYNHSAHPVPLSGDRASVLKISQNGIFINGAVCWYNLTCGNLSLTYDETVISLTLSEAQEPDGVTVAYVLQALKPASETVIEVNYTTGDGTEVIPCSIKIVTT